MNDTIGMIGLGNAGSALASALSGKRPLVGFDADPKRRDAVGRLDLEWLGSEAAVAERAGTVLLSLPRPEISRDVVAKIAAVENRPASVVETSTITPKTAQDLAAACAAAGIGFVDAAIAGGVQSMAEGQVTFLVGGSNEDFERAKPVLGLLSARIHFLGPVGAGSGAKVVNNGVMHALMVVLIEAGAMATKLGIPLATMAEILGRPDGVMRPLEHRFTDRMLNGDFDGGMSVSNARKDSTLALQTAQDFGVPLFATLAAHTPYEIAEQQGQGELDYASLAQLWEAWCGVDFTKS